MTGDNGRELLMVMSGNMLKVVVVGCQSGNGKGKMCALTA